MSRLVYSVMFVFCVSVLSVAVGGCGGENEIIVDERSAAEIDQEEEEYEEMMNEVEEISE